MSLPSMESVDRGLKGKEAEIWRDASEQYYRCLRGILHLRRNAGMPSKELNQREVQRMSGYAEHMLHMLLDQRSMLSHTAEQVRSLTALNSLLSSLYQQSTTSLDAPLPSQIEALKWARKQKLIASHMSLALSQVVLLCDALKSPPTTCHCMNVQLELVRGIERDLLLAFSWHPEPQRILCEVDQDIDQETFSLVLVSDKTWSIIVANYDRLQDIANAIAESLLNSSSLFPVALVRSICSLLREVVETVSHFRQWARDNTPQEPDIPSARGGTTLEAEAEEDTCKRFGSAFGERLETAINSILVAVQKVHHIQQSADPLLESQVADEKEQHEKKGFQCNIVEFHNYFKNIEKALNLNNVCVNVETAFSYLISSCLGNTAVAGDDFSQASCQLDLYKGRMALDMLAQLFPLVALYRKMVTTAYSWRWPLSCLNFPFHYAGGLVCRAAASLPRVTCQSPVHVVGTLYYIVFPRLLPTRGNG